MLGRSSVHAGVRFWGTSILIAWSVFLGIVAPASAEPEHGDRPIGFSRLVLRVAGDPAISFAPEEYRIHILEYLRSLGLRAVGAEDLVFEKDASREAELMLGGTIRELECRPRGARAHCRIEILWRVLDLEEDQVVYEMTARHAVYYADLRVAGKQLVHGAIQSLAGRPMFRKALGGARQKRDEVSFPSASVKRCTSGRTPMPESADGAMSGSVVVTSGKSFGSGFFLNDEGFVLTAAHVVGRRGVTIRTREGASLQAFPVRVNQASDIALLRVKERGTTRCLEIDEAGAPVGTDVYVIGSPASQDLAFSVTRGIVSGIRRFDGVDFFQTDASVSPGNSGGPILGSTGGVLGVVSWKAVGKSIEGIAFGVPLGPGLKSLGLRIDETTDPALFKAEDPQTTGASTARTVVDEPDGVPTLDPEEDRRRAEEQRRREREKRIAELTPAYVNVMKWGGLSLGGAGVLAIGASYVAYDDSKTYSEYETLRLFNDLGWIALGIGAASFTTSLFLVPDIPTDSGWIRATMTASSAGPALGVEWVH